MQVVGPNFDIFGQTGKTSAINYAFDKWGMVGLTKWMANYYSRFNINVNCISPGGYYTENMDEEIVNNYKKLTPLGRMVSEDDIKGATVLLASKAGDYITGHNLIVDGGWTSW